MRYYLLLIILLLPLATATQIQEFPDVNLPLNSNLTFNLLDYFSELPEVGLTIDDYYYNETDLISYGMYDNPYLTFFTENDEFTVSATIYVHAMNTSYQSFVFRSINSSIPVKLGNPNSYSYNISDYFANFTYLKIHIERLGDFQSVYQTENNIEISNITYNNYTVIGSGVFEDDICYLAYQGYFKRYGLLKFTKDNYRLSDCIGLSYTNDTFTITTDIAEFLQHFKPSEYNDTFFPTEKCYAGQCINESSWIVNRNRNNLYKGFDVYYFVWKDWDLYNKEFSLFEGHTGSSKNIDLYFQGNFHLNVTVTAYSIDSFGYPIEVSSNYILGGPDIISTKPDVSFLKNLFPREGNFRYVIMLMIFAITVAFFYNYLDTPLKYVMFVLLGLEVVYFSLIGYIPMYLLVISIIVLSVLFIGKIREVLVG